MAAPQSGYQPRARKQDIVMLLSTTVPVLPYAPATLAAGCEFSRWHSYQSRSKSVCPYSGWSRLW
jgi:hypothetical protein